MADANHNQLPPRGIAFEKKAWSSEEAWLKDDHVLHEQSLLCDTYIGTADALAKTGVFDVQLISARPHRSGTTRVVVGPSGEKWGQGYVEITVTSGRMLEVKIGISEPERARRKDAWEIRSQADQASAALRMAQQREALELLELPRSHGEYRNGCVKTLRAHLNIVRNTVIAVNKYSGFHFDGDAVRAFDRATEELVKTVLRGGIRFVPIVQEQRIAEIKSQSSRVDMPFQNFLQHVTHVTARTDGTEDPSA
jgi:hypothetical protein